jgi:photosystem II stability/assembly factor-like uncharacterized protein
VGDQGTILRSTDGGVTWESQASGADVSLNGVDAVDGDVAWAVGEEGTLLRTIDGGVTWALGRGGGIGSNPITAIAGVDANVAWFASVATNGETLRTTDGGESWRSMGPALNVRDVAVLDNSVLAVGQAIHQLMLDDDTWRPPDGWPGLSDKLNAISLEDASHGWAVGEVGTILRLSPR